MNNKEAINIISQMIKDEEGFLSDNTVKAHKMAIRALEQEPCEDAISRQAVMEHYSTGELAHCNHISRNNLLDFIEQLPPVTPQPCGDLISRKAILEEFENDQYHLEFCKEHHIERSISMEMVRIRLHDLPSVNLQPKTGHWIAQDIHNCHTDFKCSECGYIHSFMHIYGEPTADYTYCPNCGAKMVETQESENEG